jgi:hypothetical protein
MISEHDQPVAIRSAVETPASRRPQSKGITIVSDDEEHLQDFAEYMP